MTTSISPSRSTVIPFPYRVLPAAVAPLFNHIHFTKKPFGWSLNMQTEAGTSKCDSTNLIVQSKVHPVLVLDGGSRRRHRQRCVSATSTIIQHKKQFSSSLQTCSPHSLTMTFK